MTMYTPEWVTQVQNNTYAGHRETPRFDIPGDGNRALYLDSPHISAKFAEPVTPDRVYSVTATEPGAHIAGRKDPVPHPEWHRAEDALDMVVGELLTRSTLEPRAVETDATTLTIDPARAKEVGSTAMPHIDHPEAA